jgi:hypothetical protein
MNEIIKEAIFKHEEKEKLEDEISSLMKAFVKRYAPYWIGDIINVPIHAYVYTGKKMKISRISAKLARNWRTERFDYLEMHISGRVLKKDESETRRQVSFKIRYSLDGDCTD